MYQPLFRFLCLFTKNVNKVINQIVIFDLFSKHRDVFIGKEFFDRFELLHNTLVLLLFSTKRVAQRKDQMCKLAVFQPCDLLLYFVMRKFAGEFFKYGLYCF